MKALEQAKCCVRSLMLTGLTGLTGMAPLDPPTSLGALLTPMQEMRLVESYCYRLFCLLHNHFEYETSRVYGWEG